MTASQLGYVYRLHLREMEAHSVAHRLVEYEERKWLEHGVQMSTASYCSRVRQCLRAIAVGCHEDWLSTGPVVRGGMG